MSRQTSTVAVKTSSTSGQVTPTIVPLVTVNRKPVVSTTIVTPTIDGTKVTKLRELAIGDVGYDWRVDKVVVLHADGNEYMMRKDEISFAEPR